jgi:hypothetical protein
MMPPSPAGQPQPKYDPRYDSKHKYKYDDKGNLIEEIVYGNEGKLRVRDVYNLKGKQREKLTYSGDGSLISRHVSILDDKGSVTEAISYNAKDDSVRDRYSYSDEYDAQGNWIRETTSKWVKKDGKEYFEPAWITYRTITYY